MDAVMDEYRCRQCHRLLFKAVLGRGTHIEKKCRDCKAINVWSISSPEIVLTHSDQLVPDGVGGFELRAAALTGEETGA
tara:strand:- start:795 stop:1031 length:237 start_codon:yes stop_codon:yes gene_type:complete